MAASTGSLRWESCLGYKRKVARYRHDHRASDRSAHMERAILVSGTRAALFGSGHVGETHAIGLSGANAFRRNVFR
jgi:hypothetical protein